MSKKTYKTYIINLDRSQTRWKNISQNFEEHGFKYHRFSAVDGRKLDQDFMDEINENKRWSLDLSPGEIGCYKSHMDVCQHFLDHDDEDFLWINEDDAQMQEGFSPELMDAILENIPSECDFLKLLCFPSKNSALVKGSFIFDHREYHFLDPHKIPLGGTTYILSRKGAQKILDGMKYLRPIDVDWTFYWENDLKIYTIAPFLPMTLSEDTDISEIGHRRKRPFFKARYYRFRLYLARWRENIKKFGPMNALKFQLAHYARKRPKSTKRLRK